MVRYGGRVRVLAATLSALAGYVDAIGFIELGGFFVSFMSGNSTRFGVGVSDRAADALLAASLIAMFVVGVIAGSLLGHFARARRWFAVLLLVAALLAAAALSSGAGLGILAGFMMALAMGAENAVFDRDGEVSIGLTYMTGTLVRFAQGLVRALLGGDPLGWLPYLLLWLGLVAGAVAGALTYPLFGALCLWAAAGAALLLAPVALRLQAQEAGSAD